MEIIKIKMLCKIAFLDIIIKDLESKITKIKKQVDNPPFKRVIKKLMS